MVHTYLVTAKHCVERAKEYGFLYLRLNRTDGRGVELLELPPDWVYPDDESVDAAVLEWQINDADLGLLVHCLPVHVWAIGQEGRQNLGIGIGNELLAVGLFTQRTGNQRNIPIVRKGIIAAMPEEPLQDRETGLEYHGYLAEMLSIGGLSGSPVFVELFNFPPVGLPSTVFQVYLQSWRSFYLLGLIRNHWQYDKKSGPVAFGKNEEPVNLGIAVVTPFDAVMELLYRDDFTKERRRADLELLKETAPLLDAAEQQKR